jgi:hypothetical protein
MNRCKYILIPIIMVLFLSCAAPKTGMEYIQLENGHTKIIDHDAGITSFIDHNGRVYLRTIREEKQNEKHKI